MSGDEVETMSMARVRIRVQVKVRALINTSSKKLCLFSSSYQCI
jgi:hypothetical protein